MKFLPFILECKSLLRRSRNPALAGLLHFIFLCSCVLVFLCMGCSQSPLCYRIGADYFPLEEGYKWIYLRASPSDTDTIQIKVADTARVYSRECWHVEQNSVPEYWWKSEMRVDKFFAQTVFVNGEEDTIAQFWVPWIQLPFVMNNSWEYSFSSQKIILNDTVKTSVKTKGKVAKLSGNTYEVETQLIRSRASKFFGTYSDTLIYYEWYVPDIGIEKRIINDTITDTLLSFSS